ncbi:MAG TPA: T9SS type A sorting domain-containing protein [Bacteroidia bacterium]|nr:T9SS type A sorting domain-containing protein [Bacteroidia bacterium]
MTRLVPRTRQKISSKTRIIVFCSTGLLLATGIFFLIANLGHQEKAMAALGMHGVKTVSSSGVILNEYTALTSNASAGTTTINVSSSTLNANGRFSGNLAAGELLMIIQMQGASISTTDASTYGSVSSYNNSGNFEFVEVQSILSATAIRLASGLARSYSISGKVQVIRVPRYSSLTVNEGASVTCPAWNGTTGGIIAIENNGASVINGTIDASAKGFRGGTVEWNTMTPGNHTTWRSTLDTDGGEKGESIAGLASTLSNGRYGRGAPANGGGGGNSHNAGGGGGANGGNTAAWNGKGNPFIMNANWTIAWNLEAPGFAANTSSGGGRGGYTWSNGTSNPITTGPSNAAWSGDNRYNVGGYGGRPLTYTASKIFMGGGGGAGDANNNVGTDGGEGGGIVYLLSGGSVTGTGSIISNGEDVPTSSGTPGDAGGGGGGGGTIFIFSNSGSVSGVTISARGGNGGSQNLNNGAEVEGNGGGGGGGYISVSNPVIGLSRSVSGGTFGVTNAPPMVNFTANGATSGGAGTIVNNPANPYTTTTALPIELKSFDARPENGMVHVEWLTAVEINNNYFTLEKSQDGINYSRLCIVSGAGNSTSELYYDWMDENPTPGLCYYRLTQTDFDGKYEVFEPVSVRMEGAVTQNLAIEKVFPNPFSDKLTITFSEQPSGGTVCLVNVAAQVVHSEKIQKNNKVLDIGRLDNIPPGIYYLCFVSNDKKVLMQKVMKP